MAQYDTSDEDSDGEFSLLDLLSPRKPKIGLVASSSYPPPSDNRVIQTPLLTQFGLAYQLKYDCILCVQCQVALGFNQSIHHATQGVINTYHFDDVHGEWRKDGGRQGARPRHSLPYPTKSNRTLYTEQELLDRIYNELFEAIGHAPDRLQVGLTSKQSVDQWTALTTLHPNQIGPVAGLKVYPHIVQCTTASCKHTTSPFHSTTLDTVKKHIKEHHKGVRKDMWTWTSVTAQTFTLHFGYMRWFMVDEEMGSTKPSAVSTELSKEEVLRRERQSLLGGIVQNVGSQRLLIDPAYETMGIAGFWSSLDLEILRPLLSLTPLGNSKTSQENRLLQRAVIATFLDIAGHVPSANPSLRLLINKGS